MGYERKRGKLAELNALLRGGSSAIASRSSSARPTVLSDVKYVITLDTDTQLPRDSARQLVGAMAHPLNRARYDEEQAACRGEGYGILQPRVAVSLPGTNRSRYARMCGSEPGIDPYTRAVSDVYQDLFGEGSFIGKGIYDVDAFERALGRALSREPDPQPRSAGRLLRARRAVERRAVVRGISVPLQRGREPPAPLDSRRLADCCAGCCRASPAPTRAVQKNPLSLLSRWKIFDNLRRSLRAGGIDAPAAARLDRAAVGLVLDPGGDRDHPDSFFDCLGPGSASEAGRCAARPASRRRSALGRPCTSPRLRFTLACLPYEAFFSLDAILRTAWRMLVTHKRLLEWNPSGDSDRDSRTDLAGSCRTMWIAPVIAAAAVIYSGGVKAGRAGCGRADTGPLVRLPRHRLVDQPAARSPPSTADSRADPLSAETFPQDLGVLRDLRRPGRSLAAARQLSGASRFRGRASHVADQHGACAAGESVRVRLRLHFGRTTHRAHDECAPHHGRPGTTPGPLLQLVRHAVAEAAAARSTFRRWTAATSRAIC